MKTAVLTLALALAGPWSLSAAPLKGNFMLSADSAVSLTKMTSFFKGRASLASNTFRVTADEITLDQSELTRRGVSVVTFRGVTSVSLGMDIPPSKEITLELAGTANIYRLNQAGIVGPAAATEHGTAFSQTLPKLDLRLKSGNASP